MSLKLASLYGRFYAETDAILGRFDTETVLASCEAAHRYCREMCLVRLHDTWARFCRELVIKSAAVEPISSTGLRIARAPGVTGEADVIPVLLSTFKKKKYEPRWGDPSECLDAAQRLKVSNLSTLIGSIGISPSPLDDIRNARNYVAHRGEATAKLVKPIARAVKVNDADLVDPLLLAPVPPGIPLFRSWVESVRIMAELAVQ